MLTLKLVVLNVNEGFIHPKNLFNTRSIAIICLIKFMLRYEIKQCNVCAYSRHDHHHDLKGLMKHNRIPQIPWFSMIVLDIIM